MQAKSIMIQGTASAVGKSIITAGLCRIFHQNGIKTAPFKSQNMALNSYVTLDGLEMGRAQEVQAHACGITPSVLMNPILLKPASDSRTQVIVNGKVLKNIHAHDYQNYKQEARNVITTAYQTLAERYELIVIEGAGSPAEINLKDNDLVNMGMAEIADAPVLLVADIDKGGVFAAIAGTLLLLTEKERQRIKGIIINKFRGSEALLKPGITQLEDIIQKPVIGVIPYTNLTIDDEDSVTDRFSAPNQSGAITIAVIKLPYISNFTDFEPLRLCPDVKLILADKPEQLDQADLLILPGTKNTIEDMRYLHRSGLGDAIRRAHAHNKAIIGICGGFQMLGMRIEDPHGVESDLHCIDGLGLFDMTTVLAEEKTTKQVISSIIGSSWLMEGLNNMTLTGYEIHMGQSVGKDTSHAFIRSADGIEGIVKENLVGTYMHGLFDTMPFTRGLLNTLRKRKGLAPLEHELNYQAARETAFNELADLLRKHLDINYIYETLQIKGFKKD